MEAKVRNNQSQRQRVVHMIMWNVVTHTKPIILNWLLTGNEAQNFPSDRQPFNSYSLPNRTTRQTPETYENKKKKLRDPNSNRREDGKKLILNSNRIAANKQQKLLIEWWRLARRERQLHALLSTRARIYCYRITYTQFAYICNHQYIILYFFFFTSLMLWYIAHIIMPVC